MRNLPALDLHAHLAPTINARDIEELGALVWAATRSLDEFEQTQSRTDAWAIWGVGCHPGLVGAQKSFDEARFGQLIGRTPLVSEVGLDGKARPAMELQRRNFRAILGILATTPRVTSIHSYAATAEVLAELEAQPVHGAVLHWWLGDADQTARAVALGCYFSVNPASVRHLSKFNVPLDRLLPETDHPFGDRFGGADRRPGNVASVELQLSRMHGQTPDELRVQMWRNLQTLVRDAGVTPLLPRSAKIALLAA